MKAIDKDWGLDPSEQGLPEVEGILEMLSTGERLTIRDIGQRWMDAGNEDISGCETGTYLLRIAVDGHPLYVEEDDDEVFYQLRYEGVEMPVEIFVRNDSIDECDIDLEFTNQSDRDHQRYIRDDVAEQQLAAEREKRGAAERKAENTELQAQIWKQEARTQSATIAEIYQLCTGKKGEPGDWNGAEPVKKALAQRDARVASQAIVDLFEFINRDFPAGAVTNAVRAAVGVRIAYLDEIAAGGGHES